MKCSCVASKCSGLYSCKAHNLACTELCKCERAEDTCNNVAISQSPSDDFENDDFENEDLDDELLLLSLMYIIILTSITIFITSISRHTVVCRAAQEAGAPHP